MTHHNHSHAVFLLNPKIRAIVAIYEPEPFEGKHNPNNKTMFKTLDQDMKIGDLIIVPTTTRHNFTTMKVIAVDVEVDYNSSQEIKWVVSRIDVAAYERTVAIENQGIQKIKDHEARKKREELKEALIGDDKELLTLSLAVIDSTATIIDEKKA